MCGCTAPCGVVQRPVFAGDVHRLELADGTVDVGVLHGAEVAVIVGAGAGLQLRLVAARCGCSAGCTSSVAEGLTDVDVSSETEVYVLITSFIESFTDTSLSNSQNIVDDIVISCDAVSQTLQEVSPSSTWSNYKSATPSENQDDYQDDIYWPMEGSRYGLDPQHAQTNGSFYIDQVSGKIHFSSNISGKTVILDYISDSLGTDGEMQVHKFAEEAMYKWMSHAILAGKANIPEYQVNRFKKERFAAIRTAKLRLSNLKLEELTQILRGKSKQIKH